MSTKEERKARWERRKSKKLKDYNHGKNGWVAGNPRYHRDDFDDDEGRVDTSRKNVTMGRN